MINADESSLIRLSALWLQDTQVCKGESVMLVIVGDEGLRRILLLLLRAVDVLIPTQLLLETARSVDDVREFLWENTVLEFLQIDNELEGCETYGLTIYYEENLPDINTLEMFSGKSTFLQYLTAYGVNMKVKSRP